ncbi:MAG: hypothetical protein V2I48_13885 [Xanthomonadales bacterium]|nr:hypothetical protein [Xanthomonadales bacterium]
MAVAGVYRIFALSSLLAFVSACGDSSDSTPQAEQERVGFEIIEIQSPNSQRAWISQDITREEFDALEVPEGWIKNQPREGGDNVEGPDSGRFLRSPDASEDGEFLDEEFFGFTWRHSATVVQAGRPMDDEGLLRGSSVRKFHELTYNAGSTLVLLISPEGLVYFRIGRDADRQTDEATIPAGWRLREYTTRTELVFNLSPRNTVIRSDNEDSFQGPVIVEALIESGEVPHPADVAPLALTQDICDAASNMAVIQDSYIWRGLMGFGGLNPDQVERMVAEPTRGPFYMLNLIRFRELAEYRDGRDTSLTGREANALYSPVEFLSAIGAGPVFLAPVYNQIDGSDYIWEEFALVEYPCPAAFFAMISDPEFQARAVHKDAGVEKTIVMVTHLQPSPVPPGFEFPPPTYPPTEDDPSFELIHVMDFHDIAQYEEGANEPERTGGEAWAEYQAGGGASVNIGSRPTAILDIQGAIIGDTVRSWDQAYIVHMPSMAGFQALLADETRQAGRYHRLAALANNYSMITYPIVNNIPDGSEDMQTPPLVPPITDTGVGTICNSDDDCVGIGFCLTDGNGPGICSRMCGSGECGTSYVCCHSCSELAALQLPFSESACIPEDSAVQLSAAPVSCICN